MNTLKVLMDALKARNDGPNPLVKYDAPADDAAAVELFAKVRAGDEGHRTSCTTLHTELLGENPAFWSGCWPAGLFTGLAVHALELEQTIRPPADARDRARLDAALSRAQKRFTEAIRELARVRRLQAPAILAQLNVVTTQTVVNGASVTGG